MTPRLMCVVAAVLSVSTAYAQEPDQRFPEVEIDAGITARKEATVEMDGLTLDVQTVVTKDESSTGAYQRRLGDVQVVIDILGSNLPEGGKSVNLRKLQATVFQLIRADGTITWKADFLDVLTQKLDQDRTFSSVEFAGGDLVVRPFEDRKDAPVRLVLSAHGGLGVRERNGFDYRSPENAAKLAEISREVAQGSCSGCQDRVAPSVDVEGADISKFGLRLGTQLEAEFARGIRIGANLGRYGQLQRDEKNAPADVESHGFTLVEKGVHASVPIPQGRQYGLGLDFSASWENYSDTVYGYWPDPSSRKSIGYRANLDNGKSNRTIYVGMRFAFTR